MKILSKLCDQVLSSCLLLLPVLLLVSGSCSADIRLLVSFAGDQLHVEKLILNTGGSDSRVVPRMKTLKDSSTDSELPVGELAHYSGALVVWTDSSGSKIRSDRIRDPRIIHAPVSSAALESRLSYKIQRNGVFLLRGPDAATLVEVNLPAIALGASQGREFILPKVNWSWKLVP